MSLDKAKGSKTDAFVSHRRQLFDYIVHSSSPGALVYASGAASKEGHHVQVLKGTAIIYAYRVFSVFSKDEESQDGKVQTLKDAVSETAKRVVDALVGDSVAPLVCQQEGCEKLAVSDFRFCSLEHLNNQQH